MASIFIKRFLSCLQIFPQDLLKKYITYAKLNVFPRLHDADMDKLTHVYAELRKESSVMICLFTKYLPVIVVCLSLTYMLLIIFI